MAKSVQPLQLFFFNLLLFIFIFNTSSPFISSFFFLFRSRNHQPATSLRLVASLHPACWIRHCRPPLFVAEVPPSPEMLLSSRVGTAAVAARHRHRCWNSTPPRHGPPVVDPASSSSVPRRRCLAQTESPAAMPALHLPARCSPWRELKPELVLAWRS